VQKRYCKPYTPVFDLRNVHVVVTRPAHQAQCLCELIESHGGYAIPFPVLEIVPKIDDEFLQVINHLKEYQLALFISPNAVNLALPAIMDQGGLPSGLQVGAVGKATAAALVAQGCSVDISPQDKFDSESLLALPAMQAVKNKKIVIFRGEGGRELLATTLRQRGAEVQYAECYRRIKPAIDPEPLLALWTQQKLDIIVTTSTEGLCNLMEMVGNAGRDALLTTPLLVVSERMAAEARRLGFKAPVVTAAKAGDQDILLALRQWARQTRQ
jgi:uroporphyrinogen-III synthase